MTLYKSYRIIEGNVRWVIIDEQGYILNKNPTKGELKDLKINFDRDYHPNRCKSTICGRCGKALDFAYREKDTEGNLTGKWICSHCRNKDYYINICKTRYLTAIKPIANSRSGNLDRFNSFGKMMIGQWITGKTLEIKDLNIENDNFKEPVDHNRHPMYGYIDTKINSYNKTNQFWSTKSISHNFDNLCIICMDDQEPWKKVERIYMIPEIEIIGFGISICKNPSRLGWYEKFRIADEPFNDTYQSVDIPRYFSPFDLWKGKYDKK